MSNEFIDYMGGAGLNLIVALIIVRFIYYPATQDKGYVLLFLTFNTVIYFVMAMLTSIASSIGVGFGLFAVFSFLRYRTEDIPIREITYLFVMIALPLINSAIPSGEDWGKIVLANAATVLMLYVLEREWGFQFETSQVLTYEVIDLIKPQNRALLLDDLQKRTGLPVKRVEVRRIDFLHDSAQIRIYYDEPRTLVTISSQVSGDAVAPANILRNVGIISLAAVGAALVGAGGFVAGLSGFLTIGH